MTEPFSTALEQQAARDRTWLAAHERAMRQVFESARDELDDTYASLPEPFRRRIETFRRTNPNFRWQYELYELAVCLDALRIAEYISTNLAELSNAGIEVYLERFLELSRDDQLKAGIEETHTEHSVAFAARLARRWLTDPGLVAAEHGALCDIVGCADYGCPRQDEGDA